MFCKSVVYFKRAVRQIISYLMCRADVPLKNSIILYLKKKIKIKKILLLNPFKCFYSKLCK